jgi:hypothetical protein
MANRRDSAWIALAAACALVVHLFIAGFANAAYAATGGAVICSASGTASLPDPDQPKGHGNLTDCCLSGCPLAGSPGSLPGVAFVFPPAAHAATLLLPRGSRVDARQERSPLNPRGPPAAV